ncbi:MAG: 50S ribosomal protein L5 [Candidatus Levybacteria bacterium RIFCSPHIGHO2_01_FULL_36_15]|nr:MAG: 50S ribosomal protein L5 [Candidatus Levybacteria bacterium RIFCSPHIGHO2_01_FULL_36_15]OGH38365.1 MAG: 50S ribosomal protein L5 [Candidatus Levybacteria bacterium RIFCSPLOWO2_01_FULL_36_10]
MADFKKIFEKEKIKELQDKLGIKNSMAVPKLEKIVINASNKEFLQDKKNLEKAAEELALITGQKPKITKARLSVATFKLREGDKIGLVVTLRGNRMYEFFEKLVKIVLPRVKDFAGINPKSFDGRGNLTIGFAEHTVFPEIEPGKVDKIRSLQIIIVTSARTDEKAKVLMETMGMPFKKVKS